MWADDAAEMVSVALPDVLRVAGSAGLKQRLLQLDESELIVERPKTRTWKAMHSGKRGAA